jgi:two-component system, chemotaxis family, chemotaxis protein CheY
MGKKILVVDDSATMLLSLRTTLEMFDFEVETAGDGLEALEKLKAGCRPDLVITDVHMPKMDGLELIKNARTMPGMSFTPILTLTTESEAGKRDEAKRLGATGWLVKPIAGPELIKVIKQVLPGS